MTDLQMCYELGQMAAMSGQTIDDCSFRTQAKCASWLRGFNDFKNRSGEAAHLSDQEKRAGLQAIKNLKTFLAGRSDVATSQ